MPPSRRSPPRGPSIMGTANIVLITLAIQLTLVSVVSGGGIPPVNVEVQVARSGCIYGTTSANAHTLHLLSLSEPSTVMSSIQLLDTDSLVASDEEILRFSSAYGPESLWFPTSLGIREVRLGESDILADDNGAYYDTRQVSVRWHAGGRAQWIAAPTRGQYVYIGVSAAHGGPPTSYSVFRVTYSHTSGTETQIFTEGLIPTEVASGIDRILLITEDRLLCHSEAREVAEYDGVTGQKGRVWSDMFPENGATGAFRDMAKNLNRVFFAFAPSNGDENGDENGEIHVYNMQGLFIEKHSVVSDPFTILVAPTTGLLYIGGEEGVVRSYTTARWGLKEVLRHSKVASSGASWRTITHAACPSVDLAPYSSQVQALQASSGNPTGSSMENATIIIVLSVLLLVVIVVAVVLYLLSQKLSRDRRRLAEQDAEKRADATPRDEPPPPLKNRKGRAPSDTGSDQSLPLNWTSAKLRRIHPVTIQWEEKPQVTLAHSSATLALSQLVQSGTIAPLSVIPPRTPRSDTGSDARSDHPSTIAGDGQSDFLSTGEPATVVFRDISSQQLQLLGYLGSGGFADVYLARWHGIDVAVKLLKTSSVRDGLKSFQKEINILSRLTHPNVTLMLGGSARGGEVLIVTEYKCGGSLWDLLSRLKRNRRRLTRKQIWLLACDICSGLDYLHNATPVIIHRDLKSANILLNEHGRGCVVDFGLSRLAAETTMTRHIGTPGWMAPEVLLGSGHYTPAVDVYALGVTMWEMFSLETPFSGMENMDVISLLVRDPNTRPDMARGVPPIWSDLIESCWHSNPDLRPTVQQVRSTLLSQRAQFQSDIEAASQLTPDSTPTPYRKSPNRTPDLTPRTDQGTS